MIALAENQILLSPPPLDYTNTSGIAVSRNAYQAAGDVNFGTVVDVNIPPTAGEWVPGDRVFFTKGKATPIRVGGVKYLLVSLHDCHAIEPSHV